MKKIIFILLSILMIGGLVYAGLCNMGGYTDSHNNGEGQNIEHSCMMGESNQEDCIMGGEGKGHGMQNMGEGGHGMQNMSEEEKINHFQDMLGKKGDKMTEISKNLEEIIELADKVGYDTSKLEEYQIQLENIRVEYKGFTGNAEENIQKMCGNKQKWRGTNNGMRDLMKNISIEFAKIKEITK